MPERSAFTDWNEAPLAVRFSRGASRVPYAEDWRRSVIGLAGGKPVPPWLERQVRGYVAHRSWFEEADAVALSAVLGRISKFQSLRSEDALTWSWFGTLATAAPAAQQAAIQWLCDMLELQVDASATAGVRQWERVLHPNAPTRNGPEIDAIVDDPIGALIYVEAKWRAELGTGRGASEKKRDNQIVLRRDSLRNNPALDADERPLVVLGLAQSEPDLSVYDEADASLRPVIIRWLTWRALAACPTHPHAEEFGRHLAWKEAHGS